MSCTIDHDTLKRDPERLKRETPAAGRPQMFDGVVEFFWRECVGCYSSIAVEPDVEMAARES